MRFSAFAVIQRSLLLDLVSKIVELGLSFRAAA